MRTLLLGAALAALAPPACSRAPGPSAAAVDDYLARRADATDGDVPPAPVPPLAAPTATRLALTVDRATGLPDADSGPGETDPYVELDYDGQRFTTGVVEGSLEPVWGDSFVLELRPGGVLTVTLKDEDALASDETLGVVSLPLAPLAVGATLTLDLPVRGGDGGTLTLTLVGLPRP